MRTTALHSRMSVLANYHSLPQRSVGNIKKLDEKEKGDELLYFKRKEGKAFDSFTDGHNPYLMGFRGAPQETSEENCEGRRSDPRNNPV